MQYTIIAIIDEKTKDGDISLIWCQILKLRSFPAKKPVKNQEKTQLAKKP